MKLHNTIPVVFTACPMLTRIRNSRLLFGVIFFVALLSLVMRKVAVTGMTELLRLSLPRRGRNGRFNIRLPSRVSAHLRSLALAPSVLTNNGHLTSVGVPGKALIVLVGHNGRFLVPGKRVRLRPNSGLLIVLRGGGPTRA